ncbi:MAG: hypothetical protein ABFD50_13765, partial [Smithella sp.]
LLLCMTLILLPKKLFLEVKRFIDLRQKNIISMKYINLILFLAFAITQIAIVEQPRWLRIIGVAVSVAIFAFYFGKHVENTKDTVFIDE